MHTNLWVVRNTLISCFPYVRKREEENSRYERRAWKSREATSASKNSLSKIPMLRGYRRRSWKQEAQICIVRRRTLQYVWPIVNVGCFQHRWDVIGKIRSYDNDFVCRSCVPLAVCLPVCLAVHLCVWWNDRIYPSSNTVDTSPGLASVNFLHQVTDSWRAYSYRSILARLTYVARNTASVIVSVVHHSVGCGKKAHEHS